MAKLEVDEDIEAYAQATRPLTMKEKLLKGGKVALRVGSELTGSSIRVGDNSEGNSLEDILSKNYSTELPKDFSELSRVKTKRVSVDFAELTPLRENPTTTPIVEPQLKQLSPVSEPLDKEAKIGNILSKQY